MTDPFLAEAIAEARRGLAEGGIPIGSVLVIDGRIIGRGHNRRVQKGSAVLHGEMDCLENAGRLSAADYAPDEVRNDAKVIAAYLGVEEEEVVELEAAP